VIFTTERLVETTTTARDPEASHNLAQASSKLYRPHFRIDKTQNCGSGEIDQYVVRVTQAGKSVLSRIVLYSRNFYD
jgi:hypothetical protein